MIWQLKNRKKINKNNYKLMQYQDNYCNKQLLQMLTLCETRTQFVYSEPSACFHTCRLCGSGVWEPERCKRI